ncbi:ketose-bisphosphate aldolase [Paenibacillus pasadenensis]|uniref:class II fructose-bisphosphate aldolase n=1 Tax=Paenibacillus pasadenensis TaxID=217090 RepID=UPI002040E9E8|nr:class II fructose-bisphosphate aldolase [Paenibacillus pasadenensis]MCM3747235.1 ketose-bisphosphate aldolase [Paenibacillus pasadenensis]
MSLVSSTPLLQAARANGYAVTAFNVHTLEMLQAVVEAATELNAPVILQSTMGTVKHLGADYIVTAARVAASKTHVPVALHLDHCHEFEMIVQCIRAGYTSIMIDASMKPFAENVADTKRIVELAAAIGINVEAELGKVGGVEDDITVEDHEATLADPDECAQFVAATGVATLAPAIGTAHGIYKGEPNIDFDRIGRIASRVKVPLVLHGGSGIPEEQVKRAIALGMAKMNVATELRIVFSDAIKKVFADNPAVDDPRHYLKPAKDALREAAKEKIRMCGAVGRAVDHVS